MMSLALNVIQRDNKCVHFSFISIINDCSVPMEKESRVKKTLLNAKVNTICYFASLFIAFFTRKIFLDYLGAHFIGFASTAQSLLGFLNLAELGVGTAIGYVLYKPIYNGEKDKICEIVSVFGYIYRIIGFVILGSGIILSLFLPKIFADTPFPLPVIYVGFYAFLFSSLLGYFVNYRMTLLSADQRNYVVTGYFQLTMSLKVIVQMILAIVLTNFYVYFLIEILFGIVNSCILNYKIHQTYPWLSTNIARGRKLLTDYPEIGKYVRQLFVHKISGFTQLQILPLLIYHFTSLPVVALYDNYVLISQRLKGVISGTLDSTGAGIGNLISEGNETLIYSTYKELFSFRLYIAGVIGACLFRLSSPFISVWLGHEYVLSNMLVLLIIIQVFTTVMRGATDQFLFGYGLFYDVWAPVTETVLSVAVALIAGHYLGLGGVLMGPIIASLFIAHLWKPFFLYSKGLAKPFSQYVIMFTKHVLPIPVLFFIVVYLSDKLLNYNLSSISWVYWILYSLLFTSLYAILLFVVYYSIVPSFRHFVSRFFRIKHKHTLN